MKKILHHFESGRMQGENAHHMAEGRTFWRKDFDKKLLTSLFRWDGDDLLIDNSSTTHFREFPFFLIHKTLAEKMRWIVPDANSRFGKYKLGPNLRMESPDGENIPIIAGNGEHYDVLDDWGVPAYYLVYFNDMLYLSNYVNWRFTNLNEAFANVTGKQSRSFFVYSDLVESTVVGGQVTDLLREVLYERRGNGQVYFEPQHIQYIPVRKSTIDIVETQVAETTGELASLIELGKGVTIVTLHFVRDG